MSDIPTSPVWIISHPWCRIFPHAQCRIYRHTLCRIFPYPGLACTAQCNGATCWPLRPTAPAARPRCGTDTAPWHPKTSQQTPHAGKDLKKTQQNPKKELQSQGQPDSEQLQVANRKFYRFRATIEAMVQEKVRRVYVYITLAKPVSFTQRQTVQDKFFLPEFTDVFTVC